MINEITTIDFILALVLIFVLIHTLYTIRLRMKRVKVKYVDNVGFNYNLDYAKTGDAGIDLKCSSKEVHQGYVEYGTGIHVEIPKGYVGLLFPRSSITKQNLMLKNSVGIIDSGYRGEIKFRFQRVPSEDAAYYSEYYIDQKIGQLLIMPYPKVMMVEKLFLSELSDTDRGDGGFGSTGQ